MLTAEIKIQRSTAGSLSQDEDGYHFISESDYIDQKGAVPVSRQPQHNPHIL